MFLSVVSFCWTHGDVRQHWVDKKICREGGLFYKRLKKQCQINKAENDQVGRIHHRTAFGKTESLSTVARIGVHSLLFWSCQFSFFFFFLGPHPWHMEVPRSGVELELQPLIYTTATETRHLSCVCDLYHSSRQRQIFNPLNEARGWTCVLMDAGQIRFLWVTTGTPQFCFYF